MTNVERKLNTKNSPDGAANRKTLSLFLWKSLCCAHPYYRVVIENCDELQSVFHISLGLIARMNDVNLLTTYYVMHLYICDELNDVYQFICSKYLNNVVKLI